MVFGRSRVDGKTYRLEGDATRAIIRGRRVRGYRVPDARDLCIWPYDSAGRVLSEDNLKTSFPHAYRYLIRCHPRLAERPAKDGVPWYAPSRDVSDYSQRGPRLVSSKVSSPAGFTLIDNPAAVCHNSVAVIEPDASKMDAHCLLAILNSSVFWRFIRLTTPYVGCGRQVLRLSDVRQFPIPPPTTEDQRRLFEMIGNLARQTMRTGAVPTAQEQIDALVNHLFESEH